MSSRFSPLRGGGHAGDAADGEEADPHVVDEVLGVEGEVRRGAGRAVGARRRAGCGRRPSMMSYCSLNELLFFTCSSTKS